MWRDASKLRVAVAIVSAARRAIVKGCMRRDWCRVRQSNSSWPAAKSKAMPQDANHLVWLDMEMTGLDPDRDRILEVAVVVTDSRIPPGAEGPGLGGDQ